MRQWLFDLRTDKRISQLQIAALTGITQQMYSNIEHGKRRPSVAVAKKIGAYLGFDWTRFYEDEAEAEEPTA